MASTVSPTAPRHKGAKVIGWAGLQATDVREPLMAATEDSGEVLASEHEGASSDVELDGERLSVGEQVLELRGR